MAKGDGNPTEVTGQGEDATAYSTGPLGSDFEWPMDSARFGHLPPAEYDIGGGRVGGLFADDEFGGAMALKPGPA